MHRNRTKRPFTYREPPTSRSYATGKQIDVLKPMLEMTVGEREVRPRHMLAFTEGGLVILSISSECGTINFPMSRTGAASLLSQLGHCLAQPGQ